jgi:hypothetical protein
MPICTAEEKLFAKNIEAARVALVTNLYAVTACLDVLKMIKSILIAKNFEELASPRIDEVIAKVMSECVKTLVVTVDASAKAGDFPGLKKYLARLTAIKILAEGSEMHDAMTAINMLIESLEKSHKNAISELE